jgi:hypothetical protein
MSINSCFNDDFSITTNPNADINDNVVRNIEIPNLTNFFFSDPPPPISLTLSNTSTTLIEFVIIKYTMTEPCCELSKIILNITSASKPFELITTITKSNLTFSTSININNLGPTIITLTPFDFNPFINSLQDVTDIEFQFNLQTQSNVILNNIQAVCGKTLPNVQIIQPYGCNNGRISVQTFFGNVSLTPPNGQTIENTTGIFYVLQPGRYILQYRRSLNNPGPITEIINIPINLARC